MLGLGVFEGTGCGTVNKMEDDCWDLESLRGLFLTLPTKERLLGLGVFEGTGCGTANKMEGDCWNLESLRGLVVALSTKWRMIVGTWSL